MIKIVKDGNQSQKRTTVVHHWRANAILRAKAHVENSHVNADPRARKFKGLIILMLSTAHRLHDRCEECRDLCMCIQSIIEINIKPDVLMDTGWGTVYSAIREVELDCIAEIAALNGL